MLPECLRFSISVWFSQSRCQREKLLMSSASFALGCQSLLLASSFLTCKMRITSKVLLSAPTCYRAEEKLKQLVWTKGSLNDNETLVDSAPMLYIHGERRGSPRRTMPGGRWAEDETEVGNLWGWPWKDGNKASALLQLILSAYSPNPLPPVTLPRLMRGFF